MVIFRAAVCSLGLSLAAVGAANPLMITRNRGGRHQGPDHSSRLVPANGATGGLRRYALDDHFDSVPTLGTSGTIKGISTPATALTGVRTIDHQWRSGIRDRPRRRPSIRQRTNTEIDQIGAAVDHTSGRSRWVLLHRRRNRRPAGGQHQAARRQARVRH